MSTLDIFTKVPILSRYSKNDYTEFLLCISGSFQSLTLLTFVFWGTWQCMKLNQKHDMTKLEHCFFHLRVKPNKHIQITESWCQDTFIIVNITGKSEKSLRKASKAKHFLVSFHPNNFHFSSISSTFIPSSHVMLAILFFCILQYLYQHTTMLMLRSFKKCMKMFIILTITTITIPLPSMQLWFIIKIAELFHLLAVSNILFHHYTVNLKSHVISTYSWHPSNAKYEDNELHYLWKWVARHFQPSTTDYMASWSAKQRGYDF